MPVTPSIADIFTYHPPKPGQAERYTALRGAAHAYAIVVNDLTPSSRERSLALTAIQESVMWANAAIAINED